MEQHSEVDERKDPPVPHEAPAAPHAASYPSVDAMPAFQPPAEPQPPKQRRGRNDPFLPRHELLYGVRAATRDPITGAVETAACRFCMVFGREHHGIRQRRVTRNIKYFKFPFRTDNYVSHLEKQHRDRWAHYRSLPNESKMSFFETADASSFDVSSKVSFEHYTIEDLRLECSRRGISIGSNDPATMTKEQWIAVLRAHVVDATAKSNKRKRVADELMHKKSVKGQDPVVFRLMNVIFLDFVNDLVQLPSESNADEVPTFWSNVHTAFGTSKPAYGQMIRQQFAHIDASITMVLHSAAALQAMWSDLVRAYQEKMDTGRLDVEYLQQWLLINHEATGHLEKALTPMIPDDPSVKINASMTTDGAQAATPKAGSMSPNGDVLSLEDAVAESPTEAVAAETVAPTSPTSQDYVRLKQQVLEQKKMLLAESYAHERRKHRDEQRRALLAQMREIVMAIADLRTRMGSETNSSDLEDDLQFFTLQKQDVMLRLEALKEQDDVSEG